MMYHIILFHPSLQRKENEDIVHIVDKLERCNEVALYVKHHSEAHDFSYWKEEFLNTVIFEDGTTVQELLLQPKKHGSLGKDLSPVIINIIKVAKQSELFLSSLDEDLTSRKNSRNDENDIGLVLCDIESPFETTIGCSADILELHFNILQSGRLTVGNLKSEGKYAFENLIFSKLNDSGFKDVAKSHHDGIMKALKLLNASFSKEYFELRESLDKGKALESFGINHKEIDGCSSEAYESSFDVEFEMEDGAKIIKTCTPHLKLNYNDRRQYGNYARIYFALPEDKNSPIFVGRIIPHAITARNKGKKKK